MSVGDGEPRSGDASAGDEMDGCLPLTEAGLEDGGGRTPGGRDG